MKILFIHNNYAGNNSGEEHASNGLAALLEQHGHVVEWYRRSSDEIIGSSIGNMKAFFTALYNPSAARAVKKMIVQFKPDVVQVQNLYPLISPAVFRVIRKAGIPVVMRCPNYRLFCPTGLHLNPKGQVCEKCLSLGREIHCVIKNCEQSRFKSLGYALRNFVARCYWRIQKRADIYIVQSEFQKTKFIKNGIPAEKLAIIPGLTPAIEKHAPTLGDYVTFVGRVSIEKGIEEFMEAARHLPEIPFVVAGGVDKSLADLQNNSPKNIQWLGFVKGNALDELYRDSRIIVVPGKWYEGFPNVITRAMQHSKPVITSNLGAMASIIDHEKNGLLVEPGNAAALKEAIAKLYKQPETCTQYGANGYIKAQDLYSSESIYEKLMEIYDDLNNKHAL